MATSTLKQSTNFSRVYGNKDSTLYKDSKQRGGSTNVAEQQRILENIKGANIGKPTIVEAQRILKIIENLQENLDVFQYLDADFIGRFFDQQKIKNHKDKELVNKLSPQCKDLLEKQAKLEAQFKTYASFEQQQKDENAEENQEEDEEKVREKQKIYTQLEWNFKDLLRYVKDHPEDFKIIRDMKLQLNLELQELKHCIECQRIIYLKKLSTAHEEQDQNQQQKVKLTETIDRLKKRKEQSETDKANLTKDREKFKLEKQEEVDDLRSKIKEVKFNQQNYEKELDAMIEQKREKNQRDHDEQVEKLQNELKELKADFEKKKKENKDKEKELKDRKSKFEGSLEENIRGYDEMMNQNVTERQRLTDDLDRIKKELYHLKLHFKKIEDETAREQELDQIFIKRRQEWERHERRKDAAAWHIQTAYKRFKESKGKKKKKGKKK